MPLPHTIVQCARSMCPVLLILAAGAPSAWPAELSGPPPNLITGVFRPVVEQMWRASPTFRSQCRRLATASGMTVTLSADVPRSGGSVRAFTRIIDTAKERTARVVVLAPGEAVELIAHELEHVIEHLDGVERRQDTCGRRQPRGPGKPFETCRAIEVGQVVAREVQQASRTRVQTLRQHDSLSGPLDPPSARVSADGRLVVFTSSARLLPGAAGGKEVYVQDVETHDLQLASARPGWADGYLDFRSPGLSGDGRLLVVEARRPAAHADDPFGWEIVVLDRRTATTRVIHPDEDESGAARNTTPVISADGSSVAFESVRMSAARDGAALPTILVARLDSGVIERVDVPNGLLTDTPGVSPAEEGVRTASGARSMTPTISADGRYVAFTSTVELTCAQTESCAVRGRNRGGQTMVFVRDTVARATIRVDRSVTGDEPNGHSYWPAISADGRYVAFTSEASNLVRGDRNGVADVFVYDTITGRTELVSRRGDGRPGNGPSRAPSISADGALIAFQSLASDLVCHTRCPRHDRDVNLLWDVFLVDRHAGRMVRASGDADGEWMASSRGASLDHAGRVLVFSSRHPVDANDLTHDDDLYVQIRGER